MRKLTLNPEANVTAIAHVARLLPRQMRHKIDAWMRREDMSVADAAKRLGTTDRTLRRRIDAGEIAVYTNSQGHLRVALYA